MCRIFAVGDIHGCDRLLQILLKKLPINWGVDRLIFLGDYVDRGDGVKEVIDILLDLKKRYPDSVIFLKGNHEVMFLNFLRGIDKKSYFVLGGNCTIRSYGGVDAIPRRHLAFFKSLDLYYDTEDYFFVHAGLRPGIPITQQIEDDFLWIRSRFFKSDYDWGKTIVFGHTPMSHPLIQYNKIGIDTGAVYGGELTAVELPAVKFYSAGWNDIV